jgi:hypothetical protein
MALIMNESNFQHILRVLNTNLDGKVKVMFALTSIKGVGRRFSNICCKKAEVDLSKRCAAVVPARSLRDFALPHVCYACAELRPLTVAAAVMAQGG